MACFRPAHCSPFSLLLPRGSPISSRNCIASLLLLPLLPSISHPHPIHSSLNGAGILEGGCQLDYLLPCSKLRPPVTGGIEHKLLPSMSTSVRGAPRLPCCPHSYLGESPAPSISSSASVLATGLPAILYPHGLDLHSSLSTVSCSLPVSHSGR